MSKPAFALKPEGKPHMFKSYEGRLAYGYEKPAGNMPVTKILSGAYVWLTAELHQWFVERDIPYKLGHNNKLGFFIRVPSKHFIMAKLTWG